MWPQVLLVLLSTSPSEGLDIGEVSSFSDVTEGWQVDPALDLSEAILRGPQAPVFSTADGGACVDIGRWSGTHGNQNWVWVHCPAPPDAGGASRPCQKLISSVTDLSVLGEFCPKAAVAFAELELASCGLGDFERLLRRSSSMKVRVPKTKDKAIQALRRMARYDRGVFQSETLGCAETVTSPDGRLRSWTLRRAARGLKDELERGRAYLQWLTPEGTFGFALDRSLEELQLDAILDGLTPIPGNLQEYLLTGYSLLGFDYLRFAEVITLAEGRPRLAKGRFLVEGQKEDVLIVTGGVPETGKPRHSPVYNHFLRLKGAQLWAEPIPGSSCCSRVRKPFVLGEWTGEAFTMKEGGWARLLRLRGTRVLHPGR
ncbi:hypothetical protein HUA74_35120 [Myxococcus sp. CA051A]|uniref:hypothetical protein n=1 Tax=Myxococcus sp. CA051A TaxID=2741739 RepID=UPI00157B772C|nr:hypothetical protein [Myxococcus sp. CA051A]NTX65904.1 hypothetical protein [Myxococcus sp. CA051A]